MRTYIDLPVHAWMLVVRTMLGASVAALFGATGQISGAYVAVALGFAAPSVLAQLGSVPQLAAVISGPSKGSGGLSAAEPEPPQEPRPPSTEAG
ncbi:hypothetical protein [Nocardia sp. CDC160]|uniref:hypothetical protein n=1 Tax=Nocardia sp. CDC160 TaxID=3112166 RepID=UPI002DB72783|nr:hypothetical protein [Nocardia sp. CDC160]MEC3918311.1 hypothetical protein [Nocardia sp. CDC160]